MAAATPQRRGAGGLGGALRSGLPPGGRRGAHRRLPWCAALLGPAQAGLTPFPSDPVQEGCARFQQDVFIAEQYLERDDGACSSIRGPQCQGLHGRPKGPAPAGIFSLFGTLPGDPGFFVQDEAGPYFASPVREQDEAEAEEEELLEGAAPAAPGGAAAEGPAPAARSLRLAFGGLRPELERLPRWLNLTSDLAVEAVGSFALVPASLAGVSNTTEVDGRPRVFAEVQDAVAYLRFTEPVTVDRLWLSRQDEPPDGELALPIVLRGRNGPDEQWSAYLRHGDLQAGRATPLSVAPLVVNEVVMIGCRGLLIASLRVSQLIGRADAAGSPQGGWLAAPAKRRLRSLRDVAVSRLPLPSAAPLLSVSEIHRMGHFRLRSELFEDGAAAEEPELSGEGPPGEAAEEGSTAEHREFSDARTVGVARAFLDAVVTGALAIPPDLPLAQLEADSRLYAEAFGQVTIEEAVNARGLDELYERLFTANRMDVLDLLFLHFMWSNHTGQLRAPGGTVRDRPLPSSPAPAAASSQPAAAASASATAPRAMSASVGASGAAYASSSAPRVIAERSTTYALPASSYPGATYAAPAQQAYVRQAAGTYAAPSSAAVQYAQQVGGTYAQQVGATYAAPSGGVMAGQVTYASPAASTAGGQQAAYAQQMPVGYAAQVASAASSAYAPPPAGYVQGGGGSFVPPPAALPCVAAGYGVGPQPPVQPPVQPQSLTAGMPDPGAIETQKAAYNKSLEEQAKHGEDMLRMQKQQQTEHIYQAAEAQKRQIMNQIDQQAKQQELQLSQKYSQQVMGLQQEYHHQKLILEKQANDLTLEFQQRKAQEELMNQQYEMQRQHYEEQMRFVTELNQGQQAVVQQQVVQQQAAQQAAAQMQAQAAQQMQQLPSAGSYVPPPQVPAGMVQAQSVMQAQGGGSYVPPPAPVVNGGSYVPPPEALAQTGPVGSGGASYVPPPTYAAAGYQAVPPTQYAGSVQATPQTTYMAATGMVPSEPMTGAHQPTYAAAMEHSVPTYPVPPGTPGGSYAAQAPYAMQAQYNAAPPTQYGVAPTNASMYQQPATQYAVAPTAAGMYGGAPPPYETVPATAAQQHF